MGGKKFKKISAGVRLLGTKEYALSVSKNLTG